MPYTTQQKVALAETIMKAERPLTPEAIVQGHEIVLWGDCADCRKHA